MAGGENLIRVNVMLDPAELQVIDARAAQLGVSRSALLRDAITAYLSTNPAPVAPVSEEEAQAILDEGRRLGKIMGNWDPVAEIRRWRDQR